MKRPETRLCRDAVGWVLASAYQTHFAARQTSACALFCVCTRARNNLDTCVHEFLSAKYAGQEDRVDHFQRFF